MNSDSKEDNQLSHADDPTIQVPRPQVKSRNPDSSEHSLDNESEKQKMHGGTTWVSERDGDGDLPITDELTAKPEGKYYFREDIAQGGMKNILKVCDKDTARDVVMAVMGNRKSSKGKIRRFVQEARITANLEHPNIVPIHDIGVDEFGHPYFTMKLIEGCTLATIINNLKVGNPEFIEKYNLSNLLQIFKKICDAVSFAHSRGIIHLDLKPDNIQVGDYGEVLVLDWGLAKVVGEDDSVVEDDSFQETGTIGRTTEKNLNWIKDRNIDITADGDVKGTIGYMAPEQAAGKNQSKDERTDVYALGAILYTILTWARPITGKDVDQLLDDTIAGIITPPTERAPDKYIPDALEAITLKAMSVDFEDRYQTVEELSGDIDAFVGGHVTIAEQASSLRHFMLWIKRNKMEATVVTVLVLSAVMIAGFWLTYKLKGFAQWGRGRNITPGSDMTLKEEWFARKGKWTVRGGKLRAIEGKGDTFELYYNRPVYGNIALEFDAMVGDSKSLDKSGDLSIVLAGGEDLEERYYFQVGGISNSCAIISRRGREELSASVKFKLEAGRKYHIRAEKEGEWLRLFCDGELLLSLKDIFYLGGGYVGLYTFGSGKQFWNIWLYYKGVPELATPLQEGDAFYRESRCVSDKLRTRFLQLAEDAYSRVYKSHPDKECGMQALLKRAYVKIELEKLSEAKEDVLVLSEEDDFLDALLLKGELAFREQDFEQAYNTFAKAIEEYPDERIGIIAILMGKLSSENARKMSPELLMHFWKKCASNQSSAVFRCRNRALSSIEFLKGLDFSIIDCSGNRIADLTPLKGMSIKHLDCDENRIESLEPLRGMKLQHLECSENPITSLEPLRGMPLKELSLFNCSKLNDLSPLLDCRKLEKLIIPAHIKDVEILKKLTGLKYLDTKWQDGWKKTSVDFWREFELTKNKEVKKAEETLQTEKKLPEEDVKPEEQELQEQQEPQKESDKQNPDEQNQNTLEKQERVETPENPKNKKQTVNPDMRDVRLENNKQ